MPYSIELGPDGSVNRTLGPDDLTTVDVQKPHTALADFDAEIPYSRSIRDRVLDRCRVYADGQLLFRGYLKELDWDQDRGIVRLNGPGIGDDLKDSAIERSFQNIATHEAIRQVWDNDTAFNATVRSPDVSVIKDDEIIVDASTQSELQNALGAAATDPVYVDSNGDVRLAQTTHWGKDTFGTGERGDTEAQGEVYDSNGNVLVGYIGGQFGDAGDELSVSFTLDHDIPDGEVEWSFRYLPYDADGDGAVDKLPGMEVRIDGENVGGFVDGWGSTGAGNWQWFGARSANMGGLSAGSHTVKIYQTDASDDTYDEFWCDWLGIHDGRFSYNFDNTVSNSGDGSEGTYNYLDSPQLFPDGWTQRFTQYETDFNVVEISLSTSGWNDTGGSQAVAVSFDGGTTWFEAANATSITESQPSNIGATVDYRVTLDRFGSGQERTPNTGYKGQKLGSVTVDYDGSDLSIIQDNTFRGSPFKILQDLHQRADYRWSLDHAATDGSGNLVKEVESFQRGSITKSPNWSVVNRQPKLSFTKYANEVTVYGKLASDGTRPKATVQDDDEVNTYGREPYFEVRPDLTTVDQVRNAALDLLTSRVKERDQKGTLQVLPTDIRPGYSYPVDWFADGSTTDSPLETVSFQEGADSLRGSLKFVLADDVTGTVIDQGRQIAGTRDAI